MILIMNLYHNKKKLGAYDMYVAIYMALMDCAYYKLQNKMLKGDKDKMNTIFNVLPNIMALANISRYNFHLGQGKLLMILSINLTSQFFYNLNFLANFLLDIIAQVFITSNMVDKEFIKRMEVSVLPFSYCSLVFSHSTVSLKEFLKIICSFYAG